MGQFTVPLIIAGISLAANLGLALLQPDNKIDGSRLNDLKAPKSNYGVQIPKVYGRGRVTGNLIWSDKIKEVAKKKKSGKGFGGSTTQKTYTYYGNFTVLLSERIVGVRKIWLNSKLVYNSTGDSETVDNSVAWASKYIRIHYGDPTQGLDPLEQSVLGAKAIAYRHRARITFELLPLEEFGNRFPQVSAELQGTADNPLLSDIVKDICKKTGLSDSQVDTTELADQTVSGYTIFQADTARQALGTLGQAYFFDCVESGNKLRFQKITRPTVAATITKNDLASYEFGQSRPDNFKEILTQPLELPTQVNVTFFDYNANHAEAVMRSPKIKSDNNNDENVTLPLALNSDEAKKIADRLLYLSWLRRRKFSFTLPPRFGYLEPGDVVATPFHEQIEKVQLTKVNHGANRLIECEAFLYDGAVISTTQSNPPDDPPDDPVTAPGQTQLKILDIPLVNDTDTDNGLYVSANQPASLFVSRNGGSSYEYADDLDLPSTYGSCNSVLGNWSNDSLDITNTIGVVLSHGELESISLTDLNNGANTARVGNEIIRFQTATLTGTNTYTLSNLLRGRRGTEAFIATHASNEPFTLLSDYITRINGNVTDIGKTLYFKAITGDQSLDEVAAVTHTVVGNSLKPYSPINLAASKDAAGNITLSWTRRDRKAGDRTDYANFPLSEVSEKYEIDILNGATIVRTLTSTSPSFVYGASEQLADFGALQSFITFRIHQISAVFGRGTGRTATISLSLVSSTPKITGFSPTQGSIGTSITVYGSGFVGATALAINGVNCTGVTIASDGQISSVIATGTTTGFVTVTTPGGTATSGTAFVIVAAASGVTSNVETITATKVLTATSPQRQYLTPSGSDRNVVLPNPPVADTLLYIINKGNGTLALNVSETNGGATVISLVDTGDKVRSIECHHNGVEWVILEEGFYP